MSSVGKVILISKRFIFEDGKEESEAYFVKVLNSKDNELIALRLDTSKEERLPPFGDDFYIEAKEGFYELESGQTYENPDYIGEFVVYKSEEAFKKYSYKNS